MTDIELTTFGERLYAAINSARLPDRAIVDLAQALRARRRWSVLSQRTKLSVLVIAAKVGGAGEARSEGAGAENDPDVELEQEELELGLGEAVDDDQAVEEGAADQISEEAAACDMDLPAEDEAPACVVADAGPSADRDESAPSAPSVEADDEGPAVQALSPGASGETAEAMSTAEAPSGENVDEQPAAPRAESAISAAENAEVAAT